MRSASPGGTTAPCATSTSTARTDKNEMIASRLPILREAARTIEIELRRYPMLAHSMAV